MISGTSKTTQQISQTISRPASTSHGMAIRSVSRCRGVTTDPSRVLLMNAVAQLVDDVDEVRFEGRGKRTRPRHVDALAHDDAAGPPAHHVDPVRQVHRLAQI